MTQVNLLFIRHGKTDYNTKKIIQGQADRSSNSEIKDMPLNVEGQKEARNLIPVLENYVVRPTVILSSPLLRACQTGEQISSHFKIKLIKEERLRELFFGADWEGMSVDDFKKIEFNPPYMFESLDGNIININNGNELRSYHKSTNAIYDRLSHPDGETKSEVVKRVKDSIEEFITNNPSYKTICIPTHNALMRFLLSTIDRDEATIKVENTEIVHIIYDTSNGIYSLEKRIKPVPI